MSKFIMILAILVALISHADAGTLFKIAPYTLVHTNKNFLLNFQLNEDAELSIEDGEKSFSPSKYLKNQQYQVELSPSLCGEEKEIRITRKTANALKSDVVFERKLPKADCPNAVSNYNDEFVFGFISDTQEFEDRHHEVAKVIAHHHALEPIRFIVNGGDVVQTGDDENEWFKYFSGGSAYLLDIPQIAAIGNHDYRGNPRIAIPPLFKKYMRWDGAEQYGNLFYEFKKFNLIIFNSNLHISLGQIEKTFWQWIEDKIITSKNQNKPVIIATHFPAYSSSLNRFTAEGVIKIRSTLVPMLEKYKVPLLLSGHTHMYERSFKNGVNYVVAGPAGGKPNKPSDKNPYKIAFDQNALTFTKIKISNKLLFIETYNEENRLIDSTTINL